MTKHHDKAEEKDTGAAEVLKGEDLTGANEALAKQLLSVEKTQEKLVDDIHKVAQAVVDGGKDPGVVAQAAELNSKLTALQGLHNAVKGATVALKTAEDAAK